MGRTACSPGGPTTFVRLLHCRQLKKGVRAPWRCTWADVPVVVGGVSLVLCYVCLSPLSRSFPVNRSLRRCQSVPSRVFSCFFVDLRHSISFVFSLLPLLPCFRPDSLGQVMAIVSVIGQPTCWLLLGSVVPGCAWTLVRGLRGGRLLFAYFVAPPVHLLSAVSPPLSSFVLRIHRCLEAIPICIRRPCF